MLTMAVGQTDEFEAQYAAAEILRQCDEALDGAEPHAGLLVASHDLEIEEFLAIISETHGDLPIIGCTAVAPFSSAKEFEEGATSLALFSSDDLHFRTGLGSGVAGDVEAAVTEAVESARTSDDDPALCIVTTSVEDYAPDRLVSALRDTLGDGCMIVGGGAHPEVTTVAPPWRGGAQIFGRRVVTDSLSLMLVSGPIKVSVGVGHGWHPVGTEGVITRADGAVVHEIDHRPAAEFFEPYLGDDWDATLSIPLALVDPDTGRTTLRTAMARDGDTITLFGAVPEDAIVSIAMASTDEILQGARDAVAEARANFRGGEPEAALVASCTTRNLLLGTRARQELESIRSVLGPDLPVAGFYAFGEIAPFSRDEATKFHNQTCVTVLIGT